MGLLATWLGTKFEASGEAMEGIPNLWGERYDFSELPAWRKVVCLVAAGAAMAVMVLFGSILPSKENEIYHSAPSSPVTANRQVYPVHVEGGYLRYVTPERANNLRFWRHTPEPIGGLLVTAALVLLTYRSGRRTAKRK
jgi:hypothetical protein